MDEEVTGALEEEIVTDNEFISRVYIKPFDVIVVRGRKVGPFWFVEATGVLPTGEELMASASAEEKDEAIMSAVEKLLSMADKKPFFLVPLALAVGGVALWLIWIWRGRTVTYF